jgi:hypothetical protein
VEKPGEWIGVQNLPPFPKIMAVPGLSVLQLPQDVLPGSPDQGQILLQKGYEGPTELGRSRIRISLAG